MPWEVRGLPVGPECHSCVLIQFPPHGGVGRTEQASPSPNPPAAPVLSSHCPYTHLGRGRPFL